MSGTLAGLRQFLRAAVHSFRHGEASRPISILPPIGPKRVSSYVPKGRPQLDRAAEVRRVLDEHCEGLSYSACIARVREQTGTACSRKLVAAWKAEKRHTNVCLEENNSLVARVAASIVLVIALLSVVVACSRAVSSNADTAPTSAPEKFVKTEEPDNKQSDEPRQIKIKLSLSRVEDLKVKAGEQVHANQVLADRADERQRLTAQRRAVEMTLNKLAGSESAATIVQPRAVAATEAEAMAVIRRADALAAEAARRCAVQRERINALTLLVNLPEQVREHEAAQLVNLEAVEVERRADVDLAKAKLETLRSERAERASILNADYQRDVTSAQLRQRERQRDNELSRAQLRAQLATLDNSINAAAVVRAPFSGTVRKVQWEGQSDHEISVLITLAVGDDQRAER